MAKLYVTEYKTIGFNNGGVTPIPIAREGDAVIRQPPVDFSGGAAASAVVGSKTIFVDLTADEDCLIDVGVDPDASESGTPLWANTRLQFSIPKGNKISVIALS